MPSPAAGAGSGGVAGAWGAGKGSNLTAAEVDGNVYYLYQRVSDLEANPPQANGIANIVVSGATFSVVLDDATVLGPYDIPVATPRPTITVAVSLSLRKKSCAVAVQVAL